MRKIYLALFILTSILLVSCSASSTLTLSVNQPSTVYLSKEVKNIGILNRSQPSVNYNKFDILDKILTAEEKNLDKNGAEESLKGLEQSLKNNSRFTNVIQIDSLIFKEYGIDRFSPLLKNEDIAKICSKYNIEAIYELSFYDTDAIINYKTVTNQKVNTFGIKIPIIEHQVTINTLIKTGWRLYDNINKQVSDQYTTSNNFIVSGNGINPVKAYETITNRKDEVNRISKNNGLQYGNQLLPYTIRERRLYFVKGNKNFETAQRKAQTGDWDGAGELWKKETLNRDNKIAGRAYYNMAIICEINGDLDKAIDWASKSYSEFNIKEGLQYVKILKGRINKNKILEAEKI
ncbi:MAG: DUF6340 family protein [Flavobacterium sp.]|jgi:hypothetical protein